MFSSKYESRVKRFGKTHVVCFCNEPPGMEGTLSKDRIRILDLDSLRKINKKYFERGDLPQWPVRPLVAQLWSNTYQFGNMPSSLERWVKDIW